MSDFTGHTPGTWEVEYGQLHPSSEKCSYTIRTDAFDVVSGHLAIRREEDARLIAAAPDLLAERNRLREALENMPAVTIALRTPQERDIWDSWKRATFNPDGSVRAALQEDRDE